VSKENTEGGEGIAEEFFAFSSEAEGGGEAEVPAEEAEDQTTEEAIEEPPLFTDEEPEADEEPPMAAEEDAEPFEEPTDGKPVSQKTLRERLAKQKEKHERELEKVRLELREVKNQSQSQDVLRAMYPDKEDPFGAFLADKLVLDEMVRMQGEGVQYAETFIKDALARAKARAKGETLPAKNEAKEEKTSDARVDKLLQRAIGAEVDGYLTSAKVKPEYRKALSREIVRQLGGISDIDEVSEALPKAASKALRALDWTPDLVQGKKPSDEPKKDPVTASPRGAAKSSTSKSKDEEPKKEKAPASIREWRDSGQTLLESLRAG
jgi:hypothetical protein